MKKLVYNTPNGKLTIRADGNVVLEFEHLFMQLNSSQFIEFVGFVNSNMHKLAGNIKEQAYDSFYHTALRNMKIELIGEFIKLINVPLFSPDDRYDIFDSLKEIKSNLKIELYKNELGNIITFNENAIYPN